MDQEPGIRGKQYSPEQVEVARKELFERYNIGKPGEGQVLIVNSMRDALLAGMAGYPFQFGDLRPLDERVNEQLGS